MRHLTMAVRQCFCGCGRDVSRPLNLSAFVLGMELMEWDRFRWEMRGIGELEPEAAISASTLAEMDRFIADGATLFRETIEVLHGDLLPSVHRGSEARRWIKHSEKSRKGLHKRSLGIMSKDKPPSPRGAEAHLLNRQAPERSFTGASEEALLRAGAKTGPQLTDT
jgi:hypothetical protein